MQRSPSAARQISRAEYEAVRARENVSCAALAAKWKVEVVGRDFPLHLSRTGPAVAGEWYIICEGARRNATAAQARELDRVASYDVHAVGPIYAAEAARSAQITRSEESSAAR